MVSSPSPVLWDGHRRVERIPSVFNIDSHHLAKMPYLRQYHLINEGGYCAVEL
jgi:hypothetical protein